MKYYFLSIILFSLTNLFAQTDNLVGYYAFERGDAKESRGAQEFDGFVSGAPAVSCGVKGNSLKFNGIDDYIIFAGPIGSLFERNDFVVSFYFHPTGINPRQTLFKKMDECDDNNQIFEINYLALQNAIEIRFQENGSRSISGKDAIIPLPKNRCWHHLAVQRKNKELSVYMNGKRTSRFNTNARYNIKNSFNLEFGKASCPTKGANFKGFIDELKIFRGSLGLTEIEALFEEHNPDLISPLAFPVVNIGTEVTFEIPNTCGTKFTWSPSSEIVSGDGTPSPTVKPTASTKFFVEIAYDNSGCRSLDSVLLQVFDPEKFDCTQLFVPSAFTPNGDRAPESNETLGISNAATLQEFISFEIYDRLGNRLFFSDDAFGKWDGTYNGTEADPGMYLWKISYKCNGEVVSKAGSTVLLR